MRFVVDSMLGKLAKWLRLLGIDTLYYRDASDQELIEIAAREGRILLTADRELFRCRRAATFFVSADQWRVQIRQVMRAFDLDARHAFTRCPVCNAALAATARELVRDCVPPHIFETQWVFGRCPNCGRIYWPGSHFQGAQSELEAILRNSIQSGVRDDADGRRHR
jgi:hypothetical protein